MVHTSEWPRPKPKPFPSSRPTFNPKTELYSFLSTPATRRETYRSGAIDTESMTPNGLKRRKLAHDSSDSEAYETVSSKRAQKDFFRIASRWNLEQDYELRRKTKKTAGGTARLPQINTADGRAEILQSLAVEEDEAASVGSDTEFLEGRDGALVFDQEPGQDEVEAEIPVVPEAQRILEAQEELARMATAINQNPEENVGFLKAIAQIGQSDVPIIQILALGTQMAVYKDIIPGYSIRSLAESEQKEKVSKEVRQLRQFERSLVLGYQAYLKELARCAKADAPPLPNGQTLSGVAVSCACALLGAVPHFNFRSDLLRILVGKLSRRTVDEDVVKCRQTLETLFQDDEEGRPSFEAVSMLTKMMKARDFDVDESVLNLFFSLRLLSEFSGKASQDRVDRTGEDAAQAIKKKTNKPVFRNKRERKALKEQKALEKDMALADALVSHEERDKMQSETLKLVFATYFRILKLRLPRLMGAVLEGLANYAHLINQDFFGDLLEALKDLIRHSDEDAAANRAADDGNDNDAVLPGRNLTREALLCTVTAFTLLAGQDAHNARRELHLDLSFFIVRLFKSLLALCTSADLEKAGQRVPGAPSSSSKVNFQTTTVLLLRSLTAILLPPWNIRQVPPLRLAAFSKQLMTAAMHVPDKSARALLALVADVVATHAAKVSSLWHTEERKGDGRFNPLCDTVEGSNPLASTVWEGELLRRHYSPKVREGVKLLEKAVSSTR